MLRFARSRSWRSLATYYANVVQRFEALEDGPHDATDGLLQGFSKGLAKQGIVNNDGPHDVTFDGWRVNFCHTSVNVSLEAKCAYRSPPSQYSIACDPARHSTLKGSTRTLKNWPLRPYQAILSLANSILPPIIYGSQMSVSSPSTLNSAKGWARYHHRCLASFQPCLNQLSTSYPQNPKRYIRPPGPLTYWGVNDRKNQIYPTTKSRDKTLIIGGRHLPGCATCRG
eukprot:1185849-Prorocentrum_minimum.AAC.3